jgi:hypothetical protein
VNVMCRNSDLYFLKKTWAEVKERENLREGRVSRCIEIMFSARDPELNEFIDFKELSKTVVQKIELLIHSPTESELSVVFEDICTSYINNNAPKKTYDMFWIILFDSMKSISETARTLIAQSEWFEISQICKAETVWLKMYNDNRRTTA